MNSSSAHLSLFLWSGSLILRVNLGYFPTALTLMYLGVLTRTESHLGNRCGNMTSDPQCSEHTSARAHTHTPAENKQNPFMSNTRLRYRRFVHHGTDHKATLPYESLNTICLIKHPHHLTTDQSILQFIRTWQC